LHDKLLSLTTIIYHHEKVFYHFSPCFGYHTNLYAQNEWKHEIGISYGLGTFTDVNSSYLSGIFSGKQTSYIGSFGIDYFYRPKSALGVGMVGTFSTCKWNDSDKARTKYFSTSASCPQ